MENFHFQVERGIRRGQVKEHLVDFEASKNNLWVWLYGRMPFLNGQIEAGEADVRTLIDEFNLIAIFVLVSMPKSLTRHQALELLQLFGFAISSCERHYQGAGHAPGVGKSQLAVTDELLIDLGLIARHPPRDSTYTYWEANKDDGFGLNLSFTGSSEELFFNSRVNFTVSLLTKCCDLVRPICNGLISIISEEAAACMLESAKLFLELHGHYSDYVKKSGDGNLNMSPSFFINRMRSYLVKYPIGGVVWDGPNAVNVLAQARIDYLIGLVDEEYEGTVQKRFIYNFPEVVDATICDMALPSLLDRMLEAIGMPLEAFLGADVSCFQEQTEVKAAIDALNQLCQAAIRLSKLHYYGLIQRYLVQEAKNLTPEQIAKMPVKPTGGVSGAGLEHAKHISDMRSENVIALKLDAIAKANRKG